MTVKIKEKCCCGAEFSVSDTARYGNSAYTRYKEFLAAHKICKEADAMRSKVTKIYKSDE